MIRKPARILASILLLTLFALSFSACGEKKSAYRNDVSIETVRNAAESCVTLADGYYTTDDDYFDYYFEGAGEIIEGHVIRKAKANSNINEFGIFKVKEGGAETMSTLCDAYLDLRMERWVAQADYIFAEHPKMENAEVRVFGNYVVYTILTEKDKTAVFNAIDTLLKAS